MAERRVAVVGLVGGETFGRAAVAAVEHADVVLGATRHRADLGMQDGTATWIDLTGSLDPLIEQVAEHHAAGRRTCVLTSGDPGFFGMVRRLALRFGAEGLDVHPAPSSVSLAFARAGWSWEDAAVVSAHGRDLDRAVEATLGCEKVALLTSPSARPQDVGAALRAADAGPYEVVVASRLGEAGEQVVRTDLDGLAAGEHDALSVVLLRRQRDPVMPLAWGLPEDRYQHRGGMITKSEVRSVVLAKLALPERGVLWDVGAGSGSVGIEAAGLRPGLRVVAVERDHESAERIRANAAEHGVAIEVVEGAAPEVLADLPAPDRVFVGGGGLDVLEGALGCVRPGGTVVATHALVDRAAAAHARLGHLVQVAVSRAVPVGEAGIRLEAENPVFVSWGSPT
jgi:precorrin-6Y C5,15-methyltransferase (decarboxylating)